MSTGTNRERIEQNNLKLEEIKNKVSNLPEYQNIKYNYQTVGFKTVTNKYNGVKVGNYVVSGDEGKVYKFNNDVLEEIGNIAIKSALLPALETENYIYIISYDSNTSSYILYKLNKNTDEIVELSSEDYSGLPADVTLSDLQNNAKMTPDFKNWVMMGYKASYEGPNTFTAKGKLTLISISEETNIFSYKQIDISYASGINHVCSSNIILCVGLDGNNYYHDYLFLLDWNNLSFKVLATKTATSSYSYEGGLNKNSGQYLNFYKNKIFKGGNTYECVNNSIGALIKEHSYTPYSGNDNGNRDTLIKPLNDKYYEFIYYYYASSGSRGNASKNAIFEFNEEENQFTQITEWVTCIPNGSNSIGIVDNNVYFFEQSDLITSVEINGDKYIKQINRPISQNDKVLNTATDLYTRDLLPVVGTMPNNGELNYTPSTEQQTIPAGYTSGGIVSAVDATIDENIKPENIKLGVTILGVTGTFEATPEVQEQVETLTQENEVLTQENEQLTTTVDESNELAEDILGTTV